MPLIPLLEGLVIGIIIALPVGPVGVLCVRRTLVEGVWFGFASGLGAATADALYGVVAGFGLTVVGAAVLAYRDWLGLAGGAFLLGLGLQALRAPSLPAAEPLGGEALFGAYASTFALTITNPVTLLAFAGLFAGVGVDAAGDFRGTGMLVVGVFLGSLLWWLGLSFGLAGMRRRVGRRLDLAWLNRVAGAALTAAGAALLVAAGLGLAGIRH